MPKIPLLLFAALGFPGAFLADDIAPLSDEFSALCEYWGLGKPRGDRGLGDFRVIDI